MVFKIIEENHEFLQINSVGKELHTELVELMNDVIDYIPKVNDLSTTRTPFVIYGLLPYAWGIHVSLLSGNILTCFMQLRLLIEYLAMTVISDGLPSDNMLEKLSLTRETYKKTTLSKIIKNFDSDAYQLWNSLSEWIHAKTYSKKIEDFIINDSMKTWTYVQPAPYDQDDEENLLELDKNIKTFRKILKRKFIR